MIIAYLLQFHIRVLEASPENISALLAGLEYLINISYVDDTEVFKVKCSLLKLPILLSPCLELNFSSFLCDLIPRCLAASNYTQVCLDYWNSLVLELFEAHHNLDNPAVTANVMGLQVRHVFCCRIMAFR